MLIFRWIVVLLLLVAAGCFAMYIGTNDTRYRQLGLIITKWTVLSALVFFAVVIIERMI